MALVKVRIPRTSQPQDVCGIDWSNPLSVKIGSVILNGVNLTGPTSGVTNTGDVVTGVCNFGTGPKISSTSQSISFTDQNLKPTASHAVLCVYQLLDTSGGRVAGSFASTVYGSIFLPNSTNFRFGVASSGANYIITGSAISTKPKIDIGNFDGTTLTYYENGRVSGSIAALYTSGSRDFSIGFNDAAGALSVVPLVVVFNTSLSSGEAKSLADNPWQIFEPEEQWIWVPDVSSSTVDSLTPRNIVLTAVDVSKPVVAQVHALAGQSVSTGSLTVSAPVLGQISALVGDSISLSSTVVTSPVIGQVHILTGQSTNLGVVTATTPVITQVHTLVGLGVNTGALSVTNPVVSQIHTLTVQPTTLYAVDISKPFLSSASNTDNLSAKDISLSTVVVGSSAIGQVHTLIGNTVNTGAMSVGSTVLGQVHILTDKPIVLVNVEVSKPTLTSSANTNNLSPKDITLGVVTTSSPSLGQIHVLFGLSVDTAALTTTLPSLTQIHGLTPKVIDLGIWSISNPDLSSGTVSGVYPLSSQVLIGVTYGPTGTEYTGTLIVGTGATVYIEQILSEVVDDQIIVLLQDEVIQSNILSETT